MGLELRGFASLDGSGWTAGLSHLRHSTRHASAELKNLILAGVGIYTVEQAIHKTVETAERLVKGSKQLNVSVEEFQILARAAQDANVAVDALAGSFGKMNIARAKALSGGKGSEDILNAFARLGVSREDLQNKRMAELFMGPMSQAVKQGNPEALAASMRQVGLKGFQELMHVMRQDWDEVAEELHGIMMKEEDALAIKHFKDQLERLGIIITTTVAPALVQFGAMLMRAVAWIQANVVEGVRWMLGDKERRAQHVAEGDVIRSQMGSIATIMHNQRRGIPMSNADEEYLRGLGYDTTQSALEKANEDFNARYAEWEKSAPMSGAAEFERRRKEIMDEAEAKIKAMMKGHSGGPIEADTGDFEDLFSKTGKKGKKDRADSLISVGNYLGDSAGTMERMAGRQVDLLEQILNELKHTRSPSNFGVDSTTPTRFPAV